MCLGVSYSVYCTVPYSARCRKGSGSGSTVPVYSIPYLLSDRTVLRTEYTGTSRALGTVPQEDAVLCTGQERWPGVVCTGYYGT